MKAPSREELLAGTAEAEQVLEPGTWWHYSNLAFALLGEVVARAHGGTWEEALQARILDPLGPRRARRRTSPSRPRAATSSSPTRTPSGSSPSSISAAPARSASSGRRPATWRGGARSSPSGDDRVLKASTLEEMSHVRAMVDHDGWTVGVGDWARALPPRRRACSSVTAARCPGILAGLVVDRKTKIGAAVLTNTGAGASPEKLALDLATAAIAALPRGRRTPGRPGEPAAARRSSRCSGAGGPRATRWSSRGGRAGSRRSWSAACPGATPRTSSPRARTASAASRAASAASCCASSAMRPARSRSSTSRRIRCGASRRDLLAVAGDVERGRDGDVRNDQDRPLEPARAAVGEQDRRDDRSRTARAASSTGRNESANGLIRSASSATAGIRKTATCALEASAISAASLIFPRRGDDDGAAVLGGVADDRDDHRGDEELRQARPGRRRRRACRRGSPRRAR